MAGKPKKKAEADKIDLRVNAVLGLMACWMGAVLIGLWAYTLRSAPVPGLSNAQMGLGWMGIAGTLGFAIWAISLGLPSDNGIRRLSLAPLGLSLLGALPVWIGWV